GCARVLLLIQDRSPGPLSRKHSDGGAGPVDGRALPVWTGGGLSGDAEIHGAVLVGCKRVSAEHINRKFPVFDTGAETRPYAFELDGHGWMLVPKPGQLPGEVQRAGGE